MYNSIPNNANTIAVSPSIVSNIGTGGRNNEVSFEYTWSNIASCPRRALLLQQSRRWLYLSHSSAHFTQNYWDFSLILFLSALEESHSLFFISTFGLSLSLGTVILTPYLATLVDQRPKDLQLQTMRFVLLSKHVASSLLAITCSWTLKVCSRLPLSNNATSSSTFSVLDKGHDDISFAAIMGIVGIHILGTLAQVLYQTYNIIMERDVVVILSECVAGDSADSSKFQWLSKTNATLKQIALIVPGTISVFILENNVQLACWVITIISAISLVVENLCITRIFQHLSMIGTHGDFIPQCNTSKEDACQPRENTPCISSNADVEEQVKKQTSMEDISVKHDRWALFLYLEQPIAPAGISLALLYANSVTFGNGMLSGYLLSRGVEAKMIGIYRGIASAVGLLVSPYYHQLFILTLNVAKFVRCFQGTIAFTLSLRICSLDFTGVWGVASEATSLVISTFFLSLSHENDAFLYLSMISICSSRLGLWVADISITQLQQQETPKQYRCLIGGVQEALNAFFNMIAFGLGLFFPNPSDFIYISTSGCISVSLALAFFIFGIYIPRRKLNLPVFT